MKNSNRIGMAAAVTVCVASTTASAEDREDGHHEIDQIVVTATPLSRKVEDLAQPTSILYGDELAKKQSTSIGETLSQEPGLSSSYFGPISSRPVIRGQFGERVRVLTNGLDSLDASALSEDHQVTVESLLADRIEIIRGPATLLYGSGAAGGLVNIVDKRIVETPLSKPFSAGVALGADTAVGNRDAANALPLIITLSRCPGFLFRLLLPAFGRSPVRHRPSRRSRLSRRTCRIPTFSYIFLACSL